MARRAEIRIRPATVVDAEALGALHLDVWDDAYTGLIPQPILDDRRRHADERVERWRANLAAIHGNLLAVDGDGGLVGFVNAGVPRNNDVDVDVELQALYVRAAWWGLGVGHALLEAAVGDRAAYLWVLAGNDRAISFYRRQGFALDGIQDEHAEGLHVRMIRSNT